MADRQLLDTDVIIDYVRAAPSAVEFFESLTNQPMISSMTVVELFAGVRDGAESTDLEAFLSSVRVIPLDSSIARQAGLFRRNYGPSHGVSLADAVIAATAILADATLVTLNTEHFPMVADINIP